MSDVNWDHPFWKRVAPEALSGCWLWMGPHNKKGYGRVSSALAHRISYDMTNGPIPDGMVVRHICDVPACVNPDHLLVGTMQDNHDDRRARGRIPVGASHTSSKLTESQVVRILEMHAIVASYDEIAAAVGVSKFNVMNIVSRKRWKHISAPPCLRVRRSRLTRETVTSIRSRRAAGEKLASIAKAFGISETYVIGIASGKYGGE